MTIHPLDSAICSLNYWRLVIQRLDNAINTITAITLHLDLVIKENYLLVYLKSKGLKENCPLTTYQCKQASGNTTPAIS